MGEPENWSTRLWMVVPVLLFVFIIVGGVIVDSADQGCGISQRSQTRALAIGQIITFGLCLLFILGFVLDAYVEPGELLASTTDSN